ncbi:DUF6617 family protein [Paraflavitalea speifideaquila]|uniref:DUF6617 family protein n=1 Tax=Paraflavitalea speifideaquila TaxID=3076558 RepID=UPI0028E85035|nr:DUF6617 family protein [Paraflavitalea speifideiaquila]
MSNLKEDEAGDGLFDFKGKRNGLKTLFKLLCELKLFNEDETNVDDFIKVFTTSTPSALNIKLQFACTLEKAAYILKYLQPYFYNLNDKTIELSNSFKNKQGGGITLGGFTEGKKPV